MTKNYLFQAPDHYLRRYRPFLHEDGLETSIMGLEFTVTPASFPEATARTVAEAAAGNGDQYGYAADGRKGRHGRLTITLK